MAYYDTAINLKIRIENLRSEKLLIFNPLKMPFKNEALEQLNWKQFQLIYCHYPACNSWIPPPNTPSLSFQQQKFIRHPIVSLLMEKGSTFRRCYFTSFHPKLSETYQSRWWLRLLTLFYELQAPANGAALKKLQQVPNVDVQRRRQSRNLPSVRPFGSCSAIDLII